jgi:hypothetical protein
MGLLKTVKGKVKGIIGGDGISKLVGVEDGPSSCGSVDPRDSLLKAVALIQGSLDALVRPQRNRWTFPTVEADQRAWVGGRFDPIQQPPVHFHIYGSGLRRVQHPVPLDQRPHRTPTSLRPLVITAFLGLPKRHVTDSRSTSLGHRQYAKDDTFSGAH